jgi:hypothetical protein
LCVWILKRFIGSRKVKGRQGDSMWETARSEKMWMKLGKERRKALSEKREQRMFHCGQPWGQAEAFDWIWKDFLKRTVVLYFLEGSFSSSLLAFVNGSGKGHSEKTCSSVGRILKSSENQATTDFLLLIHRTYSHSRFQRVYKVSWNPPCLSLKDW